MSTGNKDFYKVLGVSDKADTDEIRKAYRKLAKRYHPDANQGDEKASDRFKEIGEAYGVLSDPEKRKKYDQMRKFGAFGMGGRGAPRGSRPGGARAPAGGPGPDFGSGSQNFSFEDLGGLGDIFSSIFDRGRKADDRASGARGPRKGPDSELNVEVSFELAARGGKLTLKVPITEVCATCSGTGARPGTGLARCDECRGSGTVSFGQGGFAVNRPCPACGGRGRIPEDPCPSCRGSGSVQQSRTLQVKVPAGVESGDRLRISGQGERGSNGGAPGDIILTFQVKSHRFFRREGLDVHVSVPINLAQAALGSKIRVRTISGKHVVLRIPAGTQTGTRFRVRGQGVQKGERVGDQYVEVRVEIPDELSEQERQAMEAFARSAELRY